MGKKNKDEKAKNATVNIDKDIQASKSKYDKASGDMPDAVNEMSADSDALADMVKQYKKIEETLQNAKTMKEDIEHDSNIPKYNHWNGAVFEIDAEPTTGETVLGIVALGVFVIGIATLAKVGWGGLSKIRKFL